MHGSTLLTPTLDDHLLRVLSVVTPDRIRDNGAGITIAAGPGTARDHNVTRQVRHLYELGLVERGATGWCRTEAGDTYLTQHGGAL